MRDYWHKQTADQPLYPDLLWSRPENRNQAGKLLVIGGNAHGFAAPAEAVAEADRAGVGLTRVVLPQHVKKLLPSGFMPVEYAPSTPSGSFAKQSLAELLELASWSDGTLIAGDLGRNSETAIMLEQFINKYQGQLTLTQDAADYFTKQATGVLSRLDTLLVISFAQLQKIAASSGFTTAFTFEMDFLHLIDALHDFTTKNQVAILTKHLDNFFVAINGEVATTKLEQDMSVWRVKTAAKAAVWWLQNPTKTFESITSSLIN